MKQILIIALVMGLSACDQAAQNSAEQAAPFTAEDLMDVEREFAAYSKEHGFYEAFATHLTQDAVALNGGRQPTMGLDAILATFDGASGELFWYPVAADVAGSGDLGYTWGRYTFTATDEEGEIQVSHGKYFTVWKLQDDGSWKAVVDGGNPNPAPEE